MMKIRPIRGACVMARIHSPGGRYCQDFATAETAESTRVGRSRFVDGEILSRRTGGEDGPEGEAPQARRLAITILGAPVDAGAGVPGSVMGPAMLRTAGIVKSLRELGHDVDDRGDLAVPHLPVLALPPEGKAHRFA